MDELTKKSHRTRQAGTSAKKKKEKKAKNKGNQSENPNQNPKVYAFFSFLIQFLVRHVIRYWPTMAALCESTLVQAFAFRSNVKAKRLQSRTVEKEQRRLHIPTVDRSTGEAPPFVVVVHGPPKVVSALMIYFLTSDF